MNVSTPDSTGDFPSKELEKYFGAKHVQYGFMIDKDSLRQILLIDKKTKKSIKFRLITINPERKVYSLIEGIAYKVDDLGNIEDEIDECGGDYWVDKYIYEKNECYLTFCISVLYDRAKVKDFDNCHKFYNEMCPFYSIGTLRRVPW
jgi:hypothetical protein